jgi:hypothetical protein
MNRRIRDIYDKIHDCKYGGKFKHSVEILKRMKNIHLGERCFVVGNGPSLNKTNISLIKDEVFFGANGLYRGLERLGFKCKYYCVYDTNVFNKYYEELLSLESILFLGGGRAIDYIKNEERYSDFKKPVLVKRLGVLHSQGKMSTDASKGVYIGDTVIFLPLQLAFHMGFKKVYLIGVDCDYTKGHHFDGSKADSMGCGVLGEWESQFRAYEICKRTFEEHDRKIYNATVGGKLEIFERKRLEDI